jgi:hypothetical protein
MPESVSPHSEDYARETPEERAAALRADGETEEAIATDATLRLLDDSHLRRGGETPESPDQPN